MLLLRTAFKNILGGGKKTWLNVAALSFVFVIMLAYNGLLDGMTEESRRDTIEWETGWSQLWHPQYDKFDIFTLQDAHGAVPTEVTALTAEGLAEPVLVVQGSIYPQGRMQNVLVKGIDRKQQIVKIPTEKLTAPTDEIPVIIGARMARAANLTEGDRVTLRWRDRNGVFDAREVYVAYIFPTKVGAVDSGQLWMDIDDLYRMTGMEGEATYITMTEDSPVTADTDGWIYKDNDFLLTDVRLMEEATRIESVIIFIILLSIALLAVYDTQTLSIFRRQKEIGTYVALGMTPRRVTKLFTLEGTAYSIFAVLLAAVWGTPLLWLFARYGMSMPDAYGNLGMAIGDAIYPIYNVATIVWTAALVILLSALISFIPARKIARRNIVYALKGKIN